VSNHVRDCPHGVEMGQGCSTPCPTCEKEDLRRRELEHFRGVRERLLASAFKAWLKTGDLSDCFDGLVTLEDVTGIGDWYEAQQGHEHNAGT
jgi:hypothetical protein